MLSQEASSQTACEGESQVRQSPPDLECAICFGEIAQRTELPCRCNIDYCMSCWDRALAQSFNSCGWAKCPSCRLPVRVDFDAHVSRLLFSRDTELPAEPSANPELIKLYHDRTRKRIEEQARPAQIRLLEDYGMANPICPPACCEPGNDVGKRRRLIGKQPSPTVFSSQRIDYLLAEQLSLATQRRKPRRMVTKQPLLTVASEADMPGWYEQACKLAEQAAPKCVCGAYLQRVTIHERAGRLCQVLSAHMPRSVTCTMDFSRLADRFLEEYGSPCVCDLCSDSVTEGSVWTCEKGHNTVFHPNAYDVCSPCLLLHCFGVAPRTPTLEPDSETSECSSVTIV